VEEGIILPEPDGVLILAGGVVPTAFGSQGSAEFVMAHGTLLKLESLTKLGDGLLQPAHGAQGGAAYEVAKGGGALAFRGSTLDASLALMMSATPRAFLLRRPVAIVERTPTTTHRTGRPHGPARASGSVPADPDPRRVRVRGPMGDRP
jgi:hypothetical protein